MLHHRFRAKGLLFLFSYQIIALKRTITKRKPVTPTKAGRRFAMFSVFTSHLALTFFLSLHRNVIMQSLLPPFTKERSMRINSISQQRLLTR